MLTNFTVHGEITHEFWLESNAGDFGLMFPAKIGQKGYFTIKYVKEDIFPRYVVLRIVED